MHDEAQATSLISEAGRMGVALDRERALALLSYRDALLQENSRVNLTGVRDPAEAVTRLLVDSLALGLHLKELDADGRRLRVADLGSGGGLPGMVAALAFPQLELHLIESRQRKWEALLRLRHVCKLKDRVHVHGQRMATLEGERGRFDLITARAVAALPDLLKECHSFLVPGSGILVAWKSDPPDPSEMEAGARIAARLGMEALKALPYHSFKPCTLVRFRRLAP
jgi:16S rRNA (guanine527-N7)-methyltransferase